MNKTVFRNVVRERFKELFRKEGLRDFVNLMEACLDGEYICEQQLATMQTGELRRMRTGWELAIKFPVKDFLDEVLCLGLHPLKGYQYVEFSTRDENCEIIKLKFHNNLTTSEINRKPFIFSRDETKTDFFQEFVHRIRKCQSIYCAPIDVGHGDHFFVVNLKTSQIKHFESYDESQEFLDTEAIAIIKEVLPEYFHNGHVYMPHF